MILEKNYPYQFNPKACHDCSGRCCNGESGNIWVTRKEIQAIAGALALESDEFISQYLRKIGYRYSLKELKKGSNYACVFFDEEKNGCGIYEVRPEQCRSFPFWPYFKDHPQDAYDECPGITPLAPNR